MPKRRVRHPMWTGSNRNTGICYFDSPEFVSLLEFCNLFDSADNSKDWNNYLDERLYWYINDAVLFYPQHIYNLKESYQDRFIYFENSPVTMFGLPVVQEGDNGGRFETDFSLAICSESRLKNECWKFFESMLEDDFQMNMIGTLPVSKSAFDTLAQEQMIPKTYIDENGNEAIEENIYHIHTSTGGEREYIIPLMPQSYVDEIKTYISSVTYCTYYDEQVYNIIQEEAEKFFAGDQTAQQAADMIQKRSSLYLAEQG